MPFISVTFCVTLQSEDIRLEPELYDSCKQDIAKLCPNVAYGNAQVSSYTAKLTYTSTQRAEDVKN